MKSSATLSAFLVGSLMLLVALSPALALNPITTSGMRAASSSVTSWYSSNWSGYVVNGSSGSVTSVQGSWKVPTVTGTKRTTAYSSSWVGIDGFIGSSTVEQIGTDSDIQRGKPVYYAWYEFYPLQAMQRISGFTIKPGNVISASVTYSSGLFTLRINDKSTGASYSTTGTVSGATETSAEWITEAPSSFSGVLPLANFGTVNFGNDSTGVTGTCFATVGGTSAPIGSFSSVQEITMVSGTGAIKALPSPLTSDGTSFSVKWESAGP